MPPPLWFAYGWAMRMINRFDDGSTMFGLVAETRYSRMTVAPSRRVKSTYSFRLDLKFGWNASPRRPCSGPRLTLLEMFRNGVLSSLPLFWILILPVFSTMKTRPLPSRAPMANTGLLRPVADGVSLMWALPGAAATTAAGTPGAGTAAAGTAAAGTEEATTDRLGASDQP